MWGIGATSVGSTALPHQPTHSDSASWQAPIGSTTSTSPAGAAISLQQGDGADQFSARVTPGEGVTQWSAYWTVTEHGRNSRVKAGENRGEYLQHDFVVRQYTSVGRYQGAQTLGFVTIPATVAHALQIKEPLQAVSLQCGS